MKKLLFQATGKMALGLAAMALLLFAPAGSLRFWNAWLLLALLFGPMAALCAVLLFKAPELLKKRLHTWEREVEQRQVVALSVAIFAAGFVLAALDFRFGWSRLPEWLVAAASVLFLAAYGCYAEVMRENAYLSRTVEVQEGQKVIDTGSYGVVRHPMYAAAALLFLSMPLVLGSGVAVLPFLLYPPLLAKRIRNEERVLAKGLAGYREYQLRVRYRMIPFLW